MRLVCFAFLPLSFFLGAAALAQVQPAYKNSRAPVEMRVNSLFAQLTEQEKISLLSGVGSDIQAIQSIPRLGVPRLATADGAQGVRGGSPSTNGPATLFPSGVCEAATWDAQLVKDIGSAIGEEARNKGTGVQMMLGPDVNIHRSPLGGRNGESFTEDPYLNARIAVAYIEGMQNAGVGACVKHFACNNEESDRGSVDVHVDPRTLHEIYLPAFEASVKEAHVWGLMSSYNLVNGYHSSANKYLLTDVLKRGWGFDGVAMSDWGGTHETAGVVNAGTDLEMPGQTFLTPAHLDAALASGQITQASIDDSVRRILRLIVRAGLLDAPKQPDPRIVGSLAHQQLAYKAACEGIVLLKNTGSILPLDRGKVHSIALIGPRAKEWQMSAQGGVYLDPTTSVGPLKGLQDKAGSTLAINFAQGLTLGHGQGSPIPPSAFQQPTASIESPSGLRAEYFTNANLSGSPTVTRVDPSIDFDWDNSPLPQSIPHDNFSVRWSGRLSAPETGDYTLLLQADDGCRMWLDNKEVFDAWTPSAGDVHSSVFHLTGGDSYNIRVEYFQGGGAAFVHLKWIPPVHNDFSDAITAAEKSDVAIVFVGTTQESEGQDRPSMDLPDNQDALIEAVAAANKNTIVVLNNGGPVRMTKWIGSVRGVLEAFYPGEEGGRALADILLGDVNPSGKLPDTVGFNRQDYPDYGNFPGRNNVVHYSEGLYVGYRHFDKARIAPLFPFGYGLSYTTFRFSHLKLSQSALHPRGIVTATVDVTNTGRRNGTAVVELYIHDPSPKVDKAVRELKGFIRVKLMPGQTKKVSLPVNGRSLAYWDEASQRWKADAGIYQVEVGASSRDLQAGVPLHLVSSYLEPINETQKHAF